MSDRHREVRPATQAEQRTTGGSTLPISVSPLFDESISPLLGTEQSQLAATLAPQPIVETFKDPSAAARTEALAHPTIQQDFSAASKQPQGAGVAALGPLSAGVAAGNAPQPITSSAGEAITGVALSTLGGAVSGALSGAAIGAAAGTAAGPIGTVTGAVIGAVSALVISGTKAWFGVKGQRKRNRAMKEMRRKMQKQREQDIARNEKWMRLNNFNTMQAAADQREQQTLQNKWTTYQSVAANMISLVNSDASLNQTMRNQMLGVQ